MFSNLVKTLRNKNIRIVNVKLVIIEHFLAKSSGSILNIPR